VLGCTGNVASAIKVSKWSEDGGGDEEFPMCERGEFEALFMSPEGVVVLIDSEGVFLRIKPPYAIGSGAAYALGAIESGASEYDAIKAAISLDTNSDDPVVVEKAGPSGIGGCGSCDSCSKCEKDE